MHTRTFRKLPQQASIDRPSQRYASRLTRALLSGWVAISCVGISSANAVVPHEPIRNCSVVNAPIDKVWEAWTTSAGLPTFLGLGADIDLRPNGQYRVTFVPDKADPLDRGNDGKILAVEPQAMLSMTWMTPMHIKELRGNSTQIVLYFRSVEQGKKTRIDMINTGYGFGPKWAEAYTYNVRGWDRILSALEYRFNTGPIDWDKRLIELKSTGKWSFWRENQKTRSCVVK